MGSKPRAPTAFQSVVAWRERRIFANEALVRSDEPSMKIPAHVLDAAERLGRLQDLGRSIRARVGSESRYCHHASGGSAAVRRGFWTVGVASGGRGPVARRRLVPGAPDAARLHEVDDGAVNCLARTLKPLAQFRPRLTRLRSQGFENGALQRFHEQRTPTHRSQPRIWHSRLPRAATCRTPKLNLSDREPR